MREIQNKYESLDKLELESLIIASDALGNQKGSKTKFNLKNPNYLRMKVFLEIADYYGNNSMNDLCFDALQKAAQSFPNIQTLFRISEMVHCISTTDELLQIMTKILEKCDRLGLKLESKYKKNLSIKGYEDFVNCEFESLFHARQQLALLYCQSDNVETPNLLKRLNYTRRLSKSVLNYETIAEDIESKEYCYYYDDFLPSNLLHRMQHVFKSNADFWVSHDYNELKSNGYFSYIFELGLGASNFIEQIIALIFKRIQTDDPVKANQIKYAEWWAHCRPHNKGHQFHYDSENEGQGIVRHPIYSTVLYLSDEVGGPTILTNQTLGSKLASKGWSIFPKTNRLSIFDSKYLHGVVPGKSLVPNVSSRRISFMVGFWDTINVIRESDVGASRVYPIGLISDFNKLESGASFNESKVGYGMKLNSVWQDCEGNDLNSLELVHAFKDFN